MATRDQLRKAKERLAVRARLEGERDKIAKAKAKIVLHRAQLRSLRSKS